MSRTTRLRESIPNCTDEEIEIYREEYKGLSVEAKSHYNSFTDFLLSKGVIFKYPNIDK
jgi:hypothetical protein